MKVCLEFFVWAPGPRFPSRLFFYLSSVGRDQHELSMRSESTCQIGNLDLCKHAEPAEWKPKLVFIS